MEFSKKMLILHILISVSLCLVTIVGTSLLADGTWGGFYLWKSKNENRAKYAQQFVRSFAHEYGVDAAIRISEVVLKD